MFGFRALGLVRLLMDDVLYYLMHRTLGRRGMSIPMIFVHQQHASRFGWRTEPLPTTHIGYLSILQQLDTDVMWGFPKIGDPNIVPYIVDSLL